MNPEHRASRRGIVRLAIFVLLLGWPLDWMCRAQGANGALQFDGASTYVQVKHNDLLNAFPLTATAWVRTSRNAALVDGIVSQYGDASYNGYSLFLYQGHVRAWYFRDGSHYIWDRGSGIDGGALADGAWHHLAFSVGSDGGRIYVDGTQTGFLAWTGGAAGAGAPSTAVDFQIGRYGTYTNAFAGQIDEVTLWNQALSAADLNYIKHRSLGGGEDGLVAYWALNDGQGSKAADATSNHLDGNLIGGPAWVQPGAPIPLSPVAGNALRFNGVDNQAQMSDAPALNTLPLSVCAWVKTTQSSGAYPSIVTKYRGNTASGYAVALNQGRVDAWYDRDQNNYIEAGFSSASDRFIADGQWHHVAWVINTNNGTIYIDGVAANTSPWTGHAGPVVTPEPLRLGVYPDGGGKFFAGLIDHVSVWNVALVSADVNRYSHLRLTGTEPGLLAAYDMDEATGNLKDLQGRADGTVLGAARTGSLARIGDGSTQLIASLDSAAFGRTWDLRSSPAQSGFPIPAALTVWRVHDYGDAPAAVSVVAQLTPGLTDAGGNPVASEGLTPDQHTLSMAADDASSPPTASGRQSYRVTFNVTPKGQLDPVNGSYAAGASLHVQSTVGDVVDATASSAPTRLLDFNGGLLFGSVSTTFSALANSPPDKGVQGGAGVFTVLNIPSGAGSLTANAAYTFGSGQDLPVVLGPDGTATTSGSADLVPPASPDVGTVNGVSFYRELLTLDGTGAKAYVTVYLPTGLGVTPAPNIRRLFYTFPAGFLPLDAALNPTGVVHFDPVQFDAKAMWVVHEQLPELFKVGGLDWNVAAATFTILPLDTTWVRGGETAALDSLPDADQTHVAKDRPSNDGWFARASSAAGNNLVIGVDGDGRSTVQEAKLVLPPGSFTAHFPAEATVAWDQPGAFVVHNGTVDPTQSILPSQTATTVPVSPGAPSQPLTTADDTFAFVPGAGGWTFTADSGLRAEGAITPAPLRWSARDATHYAQVTGNFTTADVHVPGVLLRGSLAATSSDNRPGELLLSGHGQPGDASYVERPGTAPYAAGLADYAGLNFRVPADGAQTATSLIGDARVGPYPLRATSKYYARQAGVSGIHAADPNSFAAMASALKVYGFAFSLRDYQLAFLDNDPKHSLVSGSVSVPGVRGNAGFTQPFDQLQFDNKGNPGELVLPEPNNFEHSLEYWSVKFHPLAAQFLPHKTDPSQYALVFGAEVLVPAVLKEPVHGGLGFFPTGYLVSATDGFPGVNSRLKLPKLVTLHGTGSVLDATRPGFSVHPVTDLYFNNPDADGAPNAGFVAFAGTVKVPFFQDLRVHVLARGNGRATSVRAGWDDNGQNFFNHVNFDAGNRGLPPGVTAAAYEDASEKPGFTFYNPKAAGPQGRNIYNPLALQSWMGFVDFALPVTWDAALRRFVSSVPEQQDFLVFNSQRVIQQMTPSGADIRFGLQFNGLPRINLASLIIDDQEATQSLIQFIPNGPQLVGALQAFQQLLQGQSDALVQSGVNVALDRFLDVLFAPGGPLNNVVSAADATAAFGADGSAQFQILSGQLSSRLKGIVGTVNDANSVMHTIQDGLSKVNAGLSTADTLLAKDAQGQRGAFITQTIALAKAVGLPADAASSVTDSINTVINGEMASTLDDIQSSVNQVHDLTSSAQGLVGDIQGIIQNSLDAVNQAGVLPDQVLAALRNYFQTAHDPTGRLLAEVDPATLRAQLKQAAMDVIQQSGFVTDLQATLRDLIQPVQQEYGAAFNQIFGVINSVVQSSLQELSNQVIDHLNDQVGQANRMIGGFSDTFRLSQLEGSAQIVGDVLDSAHINGSLVLRAPDPVSLLGSIDFRRSRGDQPLPPCALAPGDGRMQITVTGRGDTKLAGGPPVHAIAQGQFTMKNDGSPLAISGSLSVDTDVHFDIIGLKHTEFDFAFGPRDNYLRAEGAGTLLIFDVDVRCFMGRTCNSDILTWLDPNIADVFSNLKVTPVDQNHPVTGYYFRGDGDVVLNRILGIPDDVVTLKGKGGQGSFVFATDDLSKVIPGAHWRFGLGVSLGPVSADATLNALGGLDPLELIKSDNVGEIATSLFTNPALIQGTVAGTFTPTFTAGPASWSKDFHFSAFGRYTPPPLAPPPGFFFVEKLDF